MKSEINEPIDSEGRNALLAAISVGARLRVACGYARLDPDAIKRRRETDAELAMEIFQAECRHQVRNLVKLEKADQVQAAIFALERRWPGRFARPKPKERPIAKKPPPPPIDLSGIAADALEQIEKIFAKSRQQE